MAKTEYLVYLIIFGLVRLDISLPGLMDKLFSGIYKAVLLLCQGVHAIKG